MIEHDEDDEDFDEDMMDDMKNSRIIAPVKE
jgi:hypothetical protein